MARILVVDDNLLIRTLLREILISGGHDVIAEAANADEAVAQAAKTRPELVTLDLVMPGRDGLQTLVELRQHDPRVRVIICSAWLTGPRVTTALRRGAHGFVAKPFDRQTLLGTVEKVIAETPPRPGAPAPAAAAPAPLVGEERGDERREFDRIAVALPVLLVHDGAATRVWTIDVSGGGMLVAAAHGALGDEVQFELTLEPGQSPIVGTARVVRASDAERCGLAFEEIRAADHERLIAYIRRQQAATARLSPTS